MIEGLKEVIEYECDYIQRPSGDNRFLIFVRKTPTDIKVIGDLTIPENEVIIWKKMISEINLVLKKGLV